MKLLTISGLLTLFLFSCAAEDDQPVGPVTGSSQIPWNAPIAGQGGGQLGSLPTNQYRR